MWRADMERAIANAAPENLLGAAGAVSYDHLVALLSGIPNDVANALLVADRAGRGAPEFLGEVTKDLVYTPVTPCRIVDSRAGFNAPLGPLQNGTVVDFSAYFVGCAVPFNGTNEPAAYALTITVTETNSPGNFRAWAFAGAVPNASVLNWNSGLTVANTTIVPTCNLCGPEVSVRVDTPPGGSAQLIVDIVGVFDRPQATPLSCLTTANIATPVAAFANFSLSAAACPTGYSSVSVNCRADIFNTVNYTSMGVNTGGTGGAQCQGTNITNVTRTMNVSQQCCRVPGF
jgi:hypothetical protein